MATRHLEDRSAVVTGSSQGIGRAVALALAAQGARVVVSGRPDAGGRSAGAEEVAAEIRARGGEALACAARIEDFDSAGALIARCADAFGSIDVLVNCAGIAEPEGSSILDVDPAEFRRVLGVHLGGTFHCCRHAAPRMAAQRRGAIVNTGSHALLGLYGGTAYPAAKGGILSLTLAMAAELREHGVRVNAVCPGARTRLSSGPAHERKIESLHARGILSRALRDASLAPPEAHCVGPLYALLASDLASGISGRVFSAAGGYVGLLARPAETPLAWRDVAARGAWELEALASVLLDSEALRA
jgi:NAD(P)-dependent dehydrogenase (short-subunit alcohol dehydrogenase family)